MGQDDENAGGPGECPGHEWVPADIQPVERNGVVGMSIVNECKWCPAVFYEPSNVDRFPETNGLDPRLL
jgi:hypothetical protein